MDGSPKPVSEPLCKKVRCCEITTALHHHRGGGHLYRGHASDQPDDVWLSLHEDQSN